MKKIFLIITCLMPLFCEAKGIIIEAEGWLETAWITWNCVDGAKNYHVYVSPSKEEKWSKLDDELVRDYGSYGRADALGLSAGNYKMKVVPVDASDKEMDEQCDIAESLEVRAHDRTGFAHFGRPESGVFAGVGAYNNDGTLKDNALVLYVTANNAKTMTHELQYTSDKKKSYTGFQTIVDGYRKCWAQGTPQPPLCIRIIGMIKDSDMDKFLSSGEGLCIKGEKQYTELPITLEGVGNDATIWGFGMQISQCVGVEVRNLGIMLCMDDAISVSSYNSHLWIHHNDLFYGKVGSDADQVKGDGTIDIKLTQACTVSYNHLFDCGKACLIDAKSVTTGWADSLTYHHNWFDHSDQRHPRCRNGNAFHIYNNYYDGNGLYGVGMACGSSAFVESNYYRNCQYPVIASAQGTDKNLVNAKQSSKGMLSGENGGIVKWYGNYVKNAHSLITQNDKSSTSFDVYAVDYRDEQIPSSVTTLKGGTKYSNFDTNSTTMYACSPDNAEDVPAIVMGKYGAGRCQKGDFKWQFDNQKEDESETLITALKTEMQDYLSPLVGFFGETIKNGGGKGTSGGDAEKHDDYVPSYVKSTAVQDIENESTSIDEQTETYNLAGQKVNEGYNGVKISKGKKTLSK